MSEFNYTLSVPIDDLRRKNQLEKMAKGHNRLGKLAPFVRDLLYDFADGKLIRIATTTPHRPASSRRTE